MRRRRKPHLLHLVFFLVISGIHPHTIAPEKSFAADNDESFPQRPLIFVHFRENANAFCVGIGMGASAANISDWAAASSTISSPVAGVRERAVFFGQILPRCLAENIIFFDEIAGVGGDDAVADAQIDHALHQFRILAVQPDFGQQMADGPRRPQAGDELIAAAVLELIVAVGEGLRHAVHLTVQGNRRRAAITVAPGQHQLRAGK